MRLTPVESLGSVRIAPGASATTCRRLGNKRILGAHGKLPTIYREVLESLPKRRIEK